jgi:hypothetical protein
VNTKYELLPLVTLSYLMALWSSRFVQLR